MIHLISHIKWGCSKRIKIILFIILLYLVAGISSAFDFSGRTSSIFCALVTISVAIASAWMTVMAYRLAKQIESAPKWLCTCCCRDSAKQVMLGYIFILGTLSVLKSWTAFDLMHHHWYEMPLVYHTQSWAYLAHNISAIIMAYIILGIFKAKYKCAQKERVFINSKPKDCGHHL